MDLDTITATLADRGNELQRRQGQYAALLTRWEALSAEVTELASQTDLLVRAGALLSSVADERQEAVRAKIEAIVSKGYEIVFGPGLSFHLVQTTRGNATVIDMMIRSTFADGSTLDTPVLEARGGGLAAVTGFLIRIVVLLLTPGHRRLLVLDESMAHLSAEYLPAMAQFMSELCRAAGVQILMVTHQDEFAEHADVAYRFSLTADGRTKVARV